MELSDLRMVEVETFMKTSPVLKVLVKVENDLVYMADLHRRICETLDLADSSHPHFALFVGGLTPVKKLRLTDHLHLSVKGLSFQKWCFDKRSERTLLQTDPNAVQLLFYQAQYNVDTGKLKPTKVQLQKLEDCLDPDFCTPKQYVDICHTVDKYFEFQLENCRLVTDLNFSQKVVPRGTVVSLACTNTGISFNSDQAQTFSWFKIESWSLCKKETTVTFTFHVSMTTVSVVTLETAQAPLLVSAIMEFFRLIRLENPSLPPFLSSMVKSLPDGSSLWENSVLNAQ